MRTKISDNNIFPIFSKEEEYKKLDDLFNKDNAYFNGWSFISIKKALETSFLSWDLRGSFTTLEEMLKGLKIRRSDFNGGCTEERLLDYIQFLLNAVAYTNDVARQEEFHLSLADESNVIENAIVSNCELIIDKLSCEIHMENNEIYISYTDDVASIVSVQNKDISDSISEYLKIDNNYDFNRKSELLCTFYKKIEPYGKEFSKTEFKKLYDDTKFLMNNIGARHYLDENNELNAVFKGMDKEELRQWYSDVFKMFLSCVSLIPYLDIKKRIKDIKCIN